MLMLMRKGKLALLTVNLESGRYRSSELTFQTHGSRKSIISDLSSHAQTMLTNQHQVYWIPYRARFESSRDSTVA